MPLPSFLPLSPLARSPPPLSHPVLLCAASPPPPSATIIGGGPAGFFCAITIARGCRGVVHSVTIVEATRDVLQKVRASGGGRCNCTNAADEPRFHEGYPHGRGRAELRSALARFSAADARAWFEAEGVPLKVEPSGKVFPDSDSSESIVRALKDAARDAGVVVRQGARVTNIERTYVDDDAPRFVVNIKGSDPIASHVVCVATGASREAHRWMETLGHEVVPPVPSLFTFNVRDPRLDGLQGLAVEDAEVRLVFPAKEDVAPDAAKNSSVKKKPRKRRRPSSVDGLVQRGPVLVTHWGLSGPAVIQLSSFGARVLHEHGYKAECVVNFSPGVTREEKLEALKSARARLAQKDVRTVCPLRGKSAMPLRLWRSLVNFAVGDKHLKWADLSNGAAEKLVDVLHCSSFKVTGKGVFKEEFVTAGGVSMKSLSGSTFESKHVPGLFVVGEAVNVDGKTGGFNFQSCWSAGFAAGQTISEMLLEQQFLRQDSLVP